MHRTTIFKVCMLGAALLQGVTAGAATLPDELITAPEGRTETWLQSGENFYSPVPGYLMQQTFADYVTKFVYGDNGELYMKNPLAGNVTDSYVKAVMNGDKMVLTLPQLIMVNGDGDKYYIGRMNESVVEGMNTYLPETENSTVTYTLVDGDWRMEESEGEWILGMFSEDLMWAGVVSWNVDIRHFEGVSATPPAGLTAQDYSMISKGSQVGSIVKVGYDGNDVWMSNLTPIMPDAWVKGVIGDGKVTFESPQYLGELDSYATILFFQGSEQVDGDFYPVGPVYMTYDSENRSFGYDKYIMINTQEEGISYYESFNAPAFKLQPAEFVCQPEDARIFFVDTYKEEYGYGQCAFFFSNITADENVMPLENLFFRVYVDGELYTFYPDEYPCLENITTEIPLTIVDPNGQIQISRDQCAFSYTFYGFDTMGVQIVYRNDDEMKESQIYEYNVHTQEGGPVGVKEIENVSSTPVSEEWYDMSGRRVQNPEKGIYVKRVLFDDGHVENVKIMKLEKL